MKGISAHTMAATGMMLWAMPAFAQAGAGSLNSAGSEAKSGQIGEIIVTAQRKDERLQDVPIVISAVSSEELAAKGISEVADLGATVANLNLSFGQGSPIIFMRGVGSTNGDPNNEPTVATYVDGVYQGFGALSLSSFNNAKRVEVLKGPQGTLFGRSATGGVIQIVTRDPANHPVVQGSVGYGNYHTVESELYATTGLAPDVAADVALRYSDQGQGWGRNRTTGQEVYKSRDYSVRSKLVFTPTDATTITVSGDYGRLRTSSLAFQIVSPHVGLDGQSHRPGRFDVEGDFNPTFTIKTWGGALRVSQDLGFADLVSITARRLSDSHFINDIDATPLPLIKSDNLGRYRQNSQEFQLISTGTSRLQWTVGAFYYDNFVTYEPITVSGILIGGAVSTFGRQKIVSWSGYGQATYALTDTTKLTAGLRYTHERSSYRGSNPAITSSDSARVKKPTWRLSIDQKLSDNTLVYASYNRGLKSGGYNLSSPGALDFKPEVLDAYEVGLKTEFFDRHVRLNLAGFYYDYANLQVTVYPADQSAGAGYIANAATARLKGLDADLQIVPFSGLTLTAGGGYLDGRYRDFANPVVSGPNPLVPVTLDNARGKRTVRSPKFTGNIGATYAWDTNVGEFSASANLSYSDRFYFDVANLFTQQDYTTVNGTVSWWNPTKSVGLKLWGKNLTNKLYIDSAFATPFGFLQTPAAPRTYGVSLMINFGE